MSDSWNIVVVVVLFLVLQGCSLGLDVLVLRQSRDLFS